MALTAKQRQVLLAFGLILATLLIYIPALCSGFVWDDDNFLTDNPHIHAANGLKLFWFSTQPPDYFPLTSSMLWFEWRVFGMNNPWGYHLINVFLHACSAVLLWRVLIKLAIPAAWLAALIFAIHPVNVESVAWITERKNVLPMVFALASTLMYLRWRNLERGVRCQVSPPPPHAHTPTLPYFLSLLCFLLALLAKTSVVMLPVAFLLLTWWKTNRITRRDILSTVPFFVLSLLLSLVTIWYQYNRAIGDFVVRDDPFFSRLAIAGRATWFYFYKALLPFDLRFVYPRWEVDSSNPLAFLPLAALALVVILLWARRSREWARACLTALLIFTAMLLPVLGFFDIFFMLYSLVADHWQYPGIAAVITLVVAGFTRLFTPTLPHSHTPTHASLLRPRIGLCLAAILVALLATKTWRQQSIYRDAETLYRSIIAKDPNCWMAQNNLGAWFYEQNRMDEAIAQWQLTIRIKPDHPEAHNNIGRVLSERALAVADADEQMRLNTEALPWCRKAIEHRPGWAEVHWNVARLITRTGGDPVEAIWHFREGLKSAPADRDALYDLAVVYGTLSNYPQAIHYFSFALRVYEQWAEPHHGIAAALGQLGRQSEALPFLVEAVTLKPGLPEAETDLGNHKFQKGDYAGAVQHFQRALETRPEFLNAAFNLHVALAQLGRFSEAISSAEYALKLAQSMGNTAVAQQVTEALESYAKQDAGSKSGP
jgi:tetratricopeptide (TPR) repeat protein